MGVPRPKALMAALHDWDSPLRLGSHHLARGLVAAGWDVAYVSNGISPPQLLKDRHEFRRRLRHATLHGRWHLEGRLWTHVPFGLATPHNAPLLRSRLVHRNWQRSTIPDVVRTVRRSGFGSVDLLYIDTPLQSFWLEAIDSRASVARIMDRSSGFHGVARELLVMEAELVRAVDLVAFAARSIEDELREAGAKRLLHLPNGVDAAHFIDGDRTPPMEYASIPRPIAIYVGDVASWFDFATFEALTERMPSVSFVLVGPDAAARARLAPRPNLHLLGPRAFGVLPRYLSNADVGLIPFDVRRFPDAVNAVHPLKLYEYLASGLSVVATRWRELELLASPATLCETVDDFVGGITRALEAPPDPGKGIAYAQAADWSGRVRLLVDALGMDGSR